MSDNPIDREGFTVTATPDQFEDGTSIVHKNVAFYLAITWDGNAESGGTMSPRLVATLLRDVAEHMQEQDSSQLPRWPTK